MNPSARGSKSLSIPTVIASCAALLGTVLVLARFSHGSWRRALSATVAPAIFVVGLLALWIIERRRGRPLLSRLGTAVALAVLGGLAGASATFLVPRLGPVWAGALPGLFYGTLMGVAWGRRPQPGPDAAPRAPGEGT